MSPHAALKSALIYWNANAQLISCNGCVAPPLIGNTLSNILKGNRSSGILNLVPTASPQEKGPTGEIREAPLSACPSP